MNLAYVVIAHKNFGQVRRLIERLDDADSRFVVVVDAGAPADDVETFKSSWAGHPHVGFTPRPVIKWGDLNLAKAGPSGVRWFLQSGFKFDFVFSITGQDYPLMSPAQIRETLAQGDGKSFILCEAFPVKRWNQGQMGRLYSWNFVLNRKVYQFPKLAPARRAWVRGIYAIVNRLVPRRGPLPMNMHPYGGSAHWTLSREAAEFVDQFIKAHPEYDRRLKLTVHADEIYVQTILANSPLKDRLIESDLRFVHWPRPESESPVVLTSADLPMIIASNAVFARKFDVAVDEKVLDLIDRHVDASASVVEAR